MTLNFPTKMLSTEAGRSPLLLPTVVLIGTKHLAAIAFAHSTLTTTAEATVAPVVEI